MKRLITGIIVIAVLVGVFALASCQTNKAESNKFDSLQSVTSVYAFSAASAGMIISQGDLNQPMSAQSGAMAMSTVADGNTLNDGNQEVANDYQELDEYMTLIGSLLSDGGFNIVEEASDNPSYTNKTVVSYKNMDGTESSYTMYYNTTEIVDDDDDDDDDIGEVEQELAIEGIMLIGEASYPIRGKTETESEIGEFETETEFYVQLDDGYMLVERSFEEEEGETEQEYTYSIYKGGKLVEKSSFEYEVEDDETEVKMVLLKDGVTNYFFFTRETEKGQEVIKLRVGNNGSGQTYIVTKVTNEDGTTSYDYRPITR